MVAGIVVMLIVQAEHRPRQLRLPTQILSSLARRGALLIWIKGR